MEVSGHSRVTNAILGCVLAQTHFISMILKLRRGAWLPFAPLSDPPGTHFAGREPGKEDDDELIKV